ncbi:aspartate--tRNA ligase [bacterium]|nr:aspartate--tRNA ligase [bacterium]
MKGLKKTCGCGELRAKDVGKEVTLMGWAHRVRDHGGLIFVDVRDRTGIVQAVCDPQKSPSAYEVMKDWRSEFVVALRGKVERRPPGTENPNLPTGEVEVIVEYAETLNPSLPPPFPIRDGIEVEEITRLKYRYIDLRRPKMVRNTYYRYKFTKAVRDFMEKEGFWEIETPILIKSTPEGARDFLVPSRLVPGSFYALPQSPQLLKQILMVSGVERYFQIARCFRDEDLRADRQPEFTQIDIEMSFVDRDDVMDLTERMLRYSFKEAFGIELDVPFPRISYYEAMERFGTDKPDMSFDMELKDVTDILSGSSFRVFADAVRDGKCIKAIKVPQSFTITRQMVDRLTDMAKEEGAKGLAVIPLGEEKSSYVAKFLTREELNNLAQRLSAERGDVLLLVADEWEIACSALGRIRLFLAGEMALRRKGFHLLWVTDFPLFKYNREEKRIEPSHHPFSAPLDEDIPLLDSDPLKVRGKVYDVILNGNEIGGGSIRIHNSELQAKVFKIIGIDEKMAEERFGFLLRAFQYGAPPHGGIALGLDRIVALALGEESIREVIAFPKTQTGSCPLTEAPSPVDEIQLKELHLKIE